MTRPRFRPLLIAFAIATATALSVRFFLVEDFRVASGSMMPTLLPGDLIFVSKSDFSLRLPFSSYEVVKIRRPLRGEVVVFGLPDRGMQTFLKRVVAIEGDVVLIKGGRLFINEKAAAYVPGKSPGRYRETLPGGGPHDILLGGTEDKDYGPVIVPKGHFFALGDNRGESLDSRTWGPVPYSCLKGRVALVWLSLAPGGKIRSGRAGTWIPAPNKAS